MRNGVYCPVVDTKDHSAPPFAVAKRPDVSVKAWPSWVGCDATAEADEGSDDDDDDDDDDGGEDDRRA